jgi:uncharacterized damage-inducible protein DinB
MKYNRTYVSDQQVPRAASPVFQHLLDTYASETNKTASVWQMFTGADLNWRPHPRSSTVAELMKHHLLSERRFMGEFIGSPEPPASEVLPAEQRVDALITRMTELSCARLLWLGSLTEREWLQKTKFFDVERERIWIFWRRVLHSAHHRTQLTMYLRLLDRPVPPIYGPTADASWTGADPTTSVEAAQRRG